MPEQFVNSSEPQEDKDLSPIQFLQQIYGNDHLATEDAKQYHKETLPNCIRKFAEESDLTENDYIAIPLGSARTLPNRYSDIDLFFILNTENEALEDIGDYSKPNNKRTQSTE